jgi:hypothetical protein
MRYTKTENRSSFLFVRSGNFTTYCIECIIIIRKHEDSLVFLFLMLYLFMSLSGLFYCLHLINPFQPSDAMWPHIFICP